MYHPGSTIPPGGGGGWAGEGDRVSSLEEIATGQGLQADRSCCGCGRRLSVPSERETALDTYQPPFGDAQTFIMAGRFGNWEIGPI